jgi:hypothetical protein
LKGKRARSLAAIPDSGAALRELLGKIPDQGLEPGIGAKSLE